MCYQQNVFIDFPLLLLHPPSLMPNNPPLPVASFCFNVTRVLLPWSPLQHPWCFLMVCYTVSLAVPIDSHFYTCMQTLTVRAHICECLGLFCHPEPRSLPFIVLQDSLLFLQTSLWKSNFHSQTPCDVETSYHNGPCCVSPQNETMWIYINSFAKRQTESKPAWDLLPPPPLS